MSYDFRLKEDVEELKAMLNLVLQEVRPDLFEEQKSKKRTVKQVIEELPEEEEDEDQEEEEEQPKPKKRKLFGRKK